MKTIYNNIRVLWNIQARPFIIFDYLNELPLVVSAPDYCRNYDDDGEIELYVMRDAFDSPDLTRLRYKN